MKLLLFNIGVCCALIFWGYKEGYRLNVTPSLPKGIYQISAESPARGDIVSFCISGHAADLAREREYLQAGSCPNGLRPLMKYLAGVPGDWVDVTADGILSGPDGGIRGLWAALPQEEDRKGRLLFSSPFQGQIPDGQALVLTSHKGGYDSRYFGLVPFDSLKKMTPVYTF